MPVETVHNAPYGVFPQGFFGDRFHVRILNASQNDSERRSVPPKAHFSDKFLERHDT